MDIRRSGILLHITSLPSLYGTGDFGPEAYRFCDFLKECGQSLWQVLPLNATGPAGDFSPYNGVSVFAGNTLLISPELLVEESLVDRKDLSCGYYFLLRRCEFEKTSLFKEHIFDVAWNNFKGGRSPGIRNSYEAFCARNKNWLADYALFVSIKKNYDKRAWNQWPPPLRDRHPASLESMKNKFRDEIEKEKFLQFLFFRQWTSLKEYCNSLGIQIIGDMPIYVTMDSADTWSNPSMFKLDRKKRPIFVSGVPPDYFSSTGQKWGNPVYNWRVLKKDGYGWWSERLSHLLRYFDIIRMDHFRGFVAFWQIPVAERTAVRGKWVKAPAVHFLSSLKKRFGRLPVIAEDLGTITPDVKKVIRKFNFPGMRVLLFAFGEDNPLNPHLPCNYIPRCVAYTGTHDNNTVEGWYKEEAGAKERKRLRRYVGRTLKEGEVHREFIRLCEESAAGTVIIPMQDILGLGSEARMNTPSTMKGNWRWRVTRDEIDAYSRERFLRLCRDCGRVH